MASTSLGGSSAGCEFVRRPSGAKPHTCPRYPAMDIVRGTTWAYFHDLSPSAHAHGHHAGDPQQNPAQHRWRPGRTRCSLPRAQMCRCLEPELNAAKDLQQPPLSSQRAGQQQIEVRQQAAEGAVAVWSCGAPQKNKHTDDSAAAPGHPDAGIIQDQSSCALLLLRRTPLLSSVGSAPPQLGGLPPSPGQHKQRTVVLARSWGGPEEWVSTETGSEPLAIRRKNQLSRSYLSRRSSMSKRAQRAASIMTAAPPLPAAASLPAATSLPAGAPSSLLRIAAGPAAGSRASAGLAGDDTAVATRDGVGESLAGPGDPGLLARAHDASKPPPARVLQAALRSDCPTDRHTRDLIHGRAAVLAHDTTTAAGTAAVQDVASSSGSVGRGGAAANIEALAGGRGGSQRMSRAAASSKVKVMGSDGGPLPSVMPADQDVAAASTNTMTMTMPAVSRQGASVSANAARGVGRPSCSSNAWRPSRRPSEERRATSVACAAERPSPATTTTTSTCSSSSSSAAGNSRLLRGVPASATTTAITPPPRANVPVPDAPSAAAPIPQVLAVEGGRSQESGRRRSGCASGQPTALDCTSDNHGGDRGAAAAVAAAAARLLMRSITDCRHWRQICTVIHQHRGSLNVLHVTAALGRLAQMPLPQPPAASRRDELEQGSPPPPPTRLASRAVAAPPSASGEAKEVQALLSELEELLRCFMRDAISAINDSDPEPAPWGDATPDHGRACSRITAQTNATTGTRSSATSTSSPSDAGRGTGSSTRSGYPPEVDQSSSSSSSGDCTSPRAVAGRPPVAPSETGSVVDKSAMQGCAPYPPAVPRLGARQLANSLAALARLRAAGWWVGADAALLDQAVAVSERLLLESFPPQELTTLVYAFAKLRHHPGGAWLDAACVSAGTAAAQRQMCPRQLSNFLWSLATLRHPPGETFMIAWTLAAVRAMARFSAYDISQAWWALATLHRVRSQPLAEAAAAAAAATVASVAALPPPRAGAPPHGLPEQFVRSALGRTKAVLRAGSSSSSKNSGGSRGWVPQDVCNTLWAVSELQLVPPRPWVQAVAGVLLEAPDAVIGRCQPADLAGLLWALARLLPDARPPRGDMVRVVKAAARLAGRCGEQDLANLLWSFGVMRFQPPPEAMQAFGRRLLELCAKGAAGPQLLSTALWCCVRLRVQPRAALLRLLLAAAARHAREFDSSSAPLLLYSLARLRHLGWLPEAVWGCQQPQLLPQPPRTPPVQTRSGIEEVPWPVALTERRLDSQAVPQSGDVGGATAKATGRLPLLGLAPFLDAALRGIAEADLHLEGGRTRLALPVLMWSVARLGHRPGEAWTRAYLAHSFEVLPLLSPSEACLVVSALLWLGHLPPPLWLERAELLLARRWGPRAVQEAAQLRQELRTLSRRTVALTAALAPAASGALSAAHEVHPQPVPPAPATHGAAGRGLNQHCVAASGAATMVSCAEAAAVAGSATSASSRPAREKIPDHAGLCGIGGGGGEGLSGEAPGEEGNWTHKDRQWWRLRALRRRREVAAHVLGERLARCRERLGMLTGSMRRLRHGLARLRTRVQPQQQQEEEKEHGQQQRQRKHQQQRPRQQQPQQKEEMAMRQQQVARQGKVRRRAHDWMSHSSQG